MTVYGYIGKKPRVVCPCGHDFKAPPPFDQPWLLEQLAPTLADLTSTSRLSVGQVPNPSYFD